MNHLWEVKNLSKNFTVKSSNWWQKPKQAKVLQDINLYQDQGETLGLVGESGCGKTTFGRVLLGIYPQTSGQIYLQGHEITNKIQRQEFLKHVQMVFQDPYASLNPRMTIREILEEPLLIAGKLAKRERKDIIDATLNEVGLSPVYGERYPHEFSGGQRQRVGIGRALITKPDCIICDEPISALDVSIQVQIVSLLEKLQAEQNLSYIFISHDLNMVQYLSQRIAVMYLGMIVELGTVADIYSNPFHPYTKALIALNGEIEAKAPIGNTLKGEVPSLTDLPKGCLFASRCPHCSTECQERRPELKEVGNRKVACWKV